MDLSKSSRKLSDTDNQQPTESSLSFMANIIEKYKVNRCTNAECKYNRDKIFDSDGLLLYDCFDHHSKVDQRRPAFLKVDKSNANAGLLSYSKNVALEILLGQKPTPSSEKHCLNGYEYLYHPLNYKTQECHVGKTSKCSTIFCPYWHNGEEKGYFEEYRKVVDLNANKFPIVEELQNNMNRVSEVVKKANDSHNGNKDEGPEPSSEGMSKAKEDQTSPENGKVKGRSKFEGYVYDETVGFIEDHYHEFKCLKLHLDTIIKYICGFLNSKGGTLYFGINNDGVVKGTDIKEYEIPSFKKKLYEALGKFVPPVGEEEVKLKFVNVYKLSKSQTVTVMANCYIVEIMMKKGLNESLYFTNYKECFVKRSATINQLKTKEIKEYVKAHIQKKNSDTLELMEAKLSQSSGRNLEGLDIKEIEALERQLQQALQKVENALGQ